jgi:hypothetical protein
MYIRGLVLLPFCLSFLSSLRNVLYSYPIQSHLSISDSPFFPSAQPSQAPCPCPALPSLPSPVLALALPRVPWIRISFPDRPLHLKPEKCEFHHQEVKYLGFIISTSGTKMDPAKVATVQEWPEPRNVKDVQSFLRFANFYRWFVKGYS